MKIFKSHACISAMMRNCIPTAKTADNTSHHHIMKVLNTITTTRYSEAYKSHMEKTYSLIRPKALTYRGAARALKNEYPDLDTASLIVTRIETAIYCR